MTGWQFWIDRGGTFTDLVARRPDGGLLTHKLLSENPEHYPDAALQGIRDLLGLATDAPIPGPADAGATAVKMGTTVATNALLERKGDRTLLLITKGFRDALRIAYQNRPHLFTRRIVLPELLYEQVVEAAERLAADGTVQIALDVETLRNPLQQALDAGIRGIAIAFLHGYRYPVHERAAADLARSMGFAQVSVSNQVSPLMKLVSRGDTTVVDAYLSPILRRYVDRVAGNLRNAVEGSAEGGTRLMFMQSNGGLTDARLFQGKDSILSGPAGGIVGAVAASRMGGFEKIITFDMGGTSTDVAHYGGELERAFETVVAGVRLRAPMMNIHTVAAGGGSICQFDGARYRVGPQSAGANPGPCAYRRGGPLTVTDCNVMLGKLQPDFFPKVFGPGGDEPLDAIAVREKFVALAADIARQTGDSRTAVEVADGFLRIAVENMANAIKKISVQRGHDVSRYTLTCFGGAGGQHACLVADALGMKTVFLHPFAGVLSAYGMGLADLRVIEERAVECALDVSATGRIAAELTELGRAARAGVARQGVTDARIDARPKARLRYAGSDAPIEVDVPENTGPENTGPENTGPENTGPENTGPENTGTALVASLRAAFEAAHRQRYGFIDDGKGLIVESLAVEAVGATEPVTDILRRDSPRDTPLRPRALVRAYMAGTEADTPIHHRDDLVSGDRIDGPAVILEPTGTNVIEPGWQATLTGHDHLVLKRVAALPAQVAIGTDVDPVMLEVFNNLFMSIAERMGLTLQNTAHSVNIKERLDFSCAIFDRGGGLIANAPHMPVHLGSMGESVRAILNSRGATVKPGDVFMLNAPYNGGTHLPDVTVITPAFDDAGTDLLFWVASRGHQADIGGIAPGSMPPDSRTVDEEGVLIDDFQIVAEGRFLAPETEALLRSGPYPARNPAQNIADLKAQIAANEKGVQDLRRMVGQFGLDVVRAYMGHVQDNAEEQVRRVLDVLTDGRFAYQLDNGAEIKVAVGIDKAARRAMIDFTGTSAQLDDNFNAPAAVCRAAVLYVFRTLIDDDIPMNEGVLKPLDIVIPEGSMLNPKPPAAVVAGNVETSQAITDTLYGALGVLAGAQGTMNNFTFGNDTHQYYETICGGSGAGPGFHGCSAVHTHMTNSRLTDPEVLEWRFPVQVEDFRVRAASGGLGEWRGGDGVIRRIRFLEPMDAAILSNHRRVAPFGLNGGAPGALGRNRVERADGSTVELGPTDRIDMDAGDVFVIETPGGGGFGGVEAVTMAAKKTT